MNSSLNDSYKHLKNIYHTKYNKLYRNIDVIYECDSFTIAKINNITLLIISWNKHLKIINISTNEELRNINIYDRVNSIQIDENNIIINTYSSQIYVYSVDKDFNLELISHIPIIGNLLIAKESYILIKKNNTILETDYNNIIGKTYIITGEFQFTWRDINISITPNNSIFRDWILTAEYKK
jgi:hypothetical protein